MTIKHSYYSKYRKHLTFVVIYGMFAHTNLWIHTQRSGQYVMLPTECLLMCTLHMFRVS